MIQSKCEENINRKRNRFDATPLAVESNLNNPDKSLQVLSDSTDDQRIRRIELLTTATGNDRDGYKAAERQAHSWFFANYDPAIPNNTETRTMMTFITTELGLSSGRISEEWLVSSHPVITTPKGRFMFGHHTGINPTSSDDVWRFRFEIVPIDLK